MKTFVFEMSSTALVESTILFERYDVNETCPVYDNLSIKHWHQSSLPLCQGDNAPFAGLQLLLESQYNHRLSNFGSVRPEQCIDSVWTRKRSILHIFDLTIFVRVPAVAQENREVVSVFESPVNWFVQSGWWDAFSLTVLSCSVFISVFRETETISQTFQWSPRIRRITLQNHHESTLKPCFMTISVF